eukprot:g3224.t1
MYTSEKDERSDPPWVEVGGEKPQEEGETAVSSAVVEESPKEEGMGEGQAEEDEGSGSADQGSPAAPKVSTDQREDVKEKGTAEGPPQIKTFEGSEQEAEKVKTRLAWEHELDVLNGEMAGEKARVTEAECSQTSSGPPGAVKKEEGDHGRAREGADVQVDKEEVVGGKIHESEEGPSTKEFQALQAKFPEETIGQLPKRYEAQQRYVLFQKACAGGVAAKVPPSVKEGGLEKKKDVMPPRPFGGKQPSREGYVGDEFGPADGVRVCGFAKPVPPVVSSAEKVVSPPGEKEEVKLKERIGSVFVRLATKLGAGMSGPVGEEFLFLTLSKELSTVTSAAETVCGE